MNRKMNFFLLLIIACLSLFMPTSFAELEQSKIVNDWCLELTNTPTDITAGDFSVKIALIDSGISMKNPFIQQDKIASGYNYVFQNTVTHDLLGHGSQTAGIIIGGNAENRHLVGIGSHATLVPLLWISKYPSGILTTGGVSAICSAIIDAVDDYDCQIINISSGISFDDPALRVAVAYAEEKGVIVISASGNSNHYEPSRIYYPAAYETVVGVGSVNEEGVVSPFSQRNKSVMVTAPGEKVYSLSSDPSKDFVQVSGTSYSTAYVSGLAALLKSKNPDMSPLEFRQILKASSQDRGDVGYDTAYGYGLIDVSHCLLLCEES